MIYTMVGNNLGIDGFDASAYTSSFRANTLPRATTASFKQSLATFTGNRMPILRSIDLGMSLDKPNNLTSFTNNSLPLV